MNRPFQTMIAAVVAVTLAACSESGPTAPKVAPAASAAGNLVGLAAPAPGVSCTVLQLDATHYEATATWSGLSVTGLEFLQGSTVLLQSQFGHPIRNGSVTDTLLTAPDLVELIGKTLGAKTPCSTAA
jgi:hypothetical protein